VASDERRPAIAGERIGQRVSHALVETLQLRPGGRRFEGLGENAFVEQRVAQVRTGEPVVFPRLAGGRAKRDSLGGTQDPSYAAAAVSHVRTCAFEPDDHEAATRDSS
jgi:hypothetical protein